MANKHKWQPHEVTRLKELWIKGLTKYEVAATLTQEFGFKCNHGMVIGRVNKLGLIRKNQIGTKITVEGRKTMLMQLTDFGAAA